MSDFEFITKLTERIQENLPGYSAQKIMEPPMRNTFSLDSSRAKRAATLLPLYKEDEWKFILIKRSSHPLDKHKGQISFPGGRLENEETPAEAAVREANEEINLTVDNISVLGKISDLFIPVSNFIVFPHVAHISLESVQLKKQETEVAEILHIPLKALLDDTKVEYHTMKMINGFELNDIPVFNLDGNIVWGATAMMLSEFKEIVREIY